MPPYFYASNPSIRKNHSVNDENNDWFFTYVHNIYRIILFNAKKIAKALIHIYE